LILTTPLQLSRLLSRLDRLGPDDPLPVIEGGRLSGDALRIGITGPLGAGKSSLINELARRYRKQGLTVGIVAVDPSSPFTGGALLGDRVRMGDLAGDDGVFVRSLATRGSTGGLARTAVDAADLIDQAGYDRVIIETVGVGQVETDIVGVCDITVVVLEPGSGDMIQSMKAGLMEIADLFLVNKMDQRGAQRYLSDLEAALELKTYKVRPGVIPTLARNGDGIDEFLNWLETRFASSKEDGSLLERRSHQRAARIRHVAEELLLKRFWDECGKAAVAEFAEDGISIRKAAQELVGRWRK
jgi:LAO/AO transport system kinase